MKYVIFLVVFLFGCEEPTDGCERNEVRCNGQTLELCDSNMNWEVQYVCPNFGLVCCHSDETFDCLEKCEE